MSEEKRRFLEGALKAMGEDGAELAHGAVLRL